MIIYFQISNYTGRNCGTWCHSPTKEERLTEFYKNQQMNEPAVITNPEYHTILYSTDCHE